MKKPNAVFDAQIAVDDVMLTGCELPRPESECEDLRPVRCGNGVRGERKGDVVKYLLTLTCSRPA